MSLMARVVEISHAVLAFLGLNLALVNAMLPTLLFALFTDVLAGLPVPMIVAVGAAAWALTGPALAAAVATYRDSHLMRFGETHDARQARYAASATTVALAPSYWRDADDTRIVRPFARTYVRLARRSLPVSVVFATLTGLLVFSALAILRVSPAGSEILAAVPIALAVFVLFAGIVALALVVGLPRARSGAVVRTALLVTARSPWKAGLGIVALGTYGYVLLVWPFLVLTVGTALLLFFVGHAALAVTTPVLDAVAADELRARAAETVPRSLQATH